MNVVLDFVFVFVDFVFVDYVCLFSNVCKGVVVMRCDREINVFGGWFFCYEFIECVYFIMYYICCYFVINISFCEDMGDFWCECDCWCDLRGRYKKDFLLLI